MPPKYFRSSRRPKARHRAPGFREKYALRLQRLAAWRKQLSIGRRVLFDIVSFVVVIIGIIVMTLLTFRLLLCAVLVFAPFLFLLGLGKSAGSTTSSEDDDDARGNGPRSMAPDYWR